VGAALLRVSPDGAETIWRSREMKNQFSSSLFHEGYIYGFDNGILECLDAATGERSWRTRGFGHGSLLRAGGHLIVLSDNGILALVEAKPGAFREMSRFQPVSGRTWTMPTLANGILYIRNERELVAFDLEPTTLSGNAGAHHLNSGSPPGRLRS
jgi:hypothetical protein